MEMLTTSEVAVRLGVSQQTVIRMFDQRRIGGFKIPGSRHRRIPTSEVERLLKDGAAKSCVAATHGGDTDGEG